MPSKSGTTGRFLSIIDPAATDLPSAATAFRSKGVEVVEQLDILNTLVLSGESAAIEEAAAAIKGVTSVEPERVVRTQD